MRKDVVIKMAVTKRELSKSSDTTNFLGENNFEKA